PGAPLRRSRFAGRGCRRSERPCGPGLAAGAEWQSLQPPGFDTQCRGPGRAAVDTRFGSPEGKRRSEVPVRSPPVLHSGAGALQTYDLLSREQKGTETDTGNRRKDMSGDGRAGFREALPVGVELQPELRDAGGAEAILVGHVQGAFAVHQVKNQ